jgi:hypothetical protein
VAAAFSIPRIFLALESDGRFDYWGAPYGALTEQQREARIRTHVDLVLWWSSIEWDRTSADIAAFPGDRFLRPGLVPFAGNGFGDQYCWYPRWRTGDDIPVLLVRHDEERSRLFARDFGECLCRCLLQSFADEVPTTSHLTPEAVWDAHVKILEPYLPAKQVDMLRSVRRHLSPTTCQEADAQLAMSIPDLSLTTRQPPTRYNHHQLDRETLVRLYDEALSFFRELIEVEGRVEFTRELEEVKAAKATL